MTHFKNCPSCNVNLWGDLIFDTFMKRYNDRDKALEAAAAYGATETTGHGKLYYGVYSQFQDRTVAFICSECGYQWKST